MTALDTSSAASRKPPASWFYRPLFPAHWNRRPLYSMAQWVNGLAYWNIEFSAAGRPIIKIAEIKGGISDQTRFTYQNFDESVRVRAGDLLFSWSGQPETSIDAFWWRGPEGWLNQHIFRVTPAAGIDATFFFYLLRYLNPNFVAIARNKQTIGLGHVTKHDLENIEAALPDRQEQRAIAHVLGTLDDKIELNRRMNETLESMAQALFKSWFVDFDPVHAKAALKLHATNATPPQGASNWSVERAHAYLDGMDPKIVALFPDRFEASELGLIPAGWEVMPLDEIAIFRNGLALQKYRPQEDEPQLPVVKIAQLRSGRADTKEWATSRIAPEHVIDDGDIIFSWSGSLMAKVWCGGRAALNQHLFKVTSPKFPQWFVLHCLHCHLADFQAAAARKATTMGHIKRQHLSEALCPIPQSQLLTAADSLLSATFKKRTSTDIQARTLAAMRDTLLLKLISGKIRLRDATKQVGNIT